MMIKKGVPLQRLINGDLLKFNFFLLKLIFLYFFGVIILKIKFKK